MTDLIYPRELARRLSRLPGARLGEGVVGVARPGLLGNPFPVSRFGRDQAVAMHRVWLLDMTDEEMGDGPLVGLKARVLARLGELRGVGMACWCALPGPYERDRCHRAVLLHIANR